MFIGGEDPIENSVFGMWWGGCALGFERGRDQVHT